MSLTRIRLFHSFVSSFLNDHPTVALLLNFFGWFCSSLTLTVINKLLYSGSGKQFGASLVFMQSLVICLILSPLKKLKIIDLSFLSMQTALTLFLPIAFFAVSDITSTNMAYGFVSISVVAVVKSCSSSLTYLLSYLFGLSQFRCLKFLCIVWICASVALSVENLVVETYTGIILSCVAVISCAFRWTITHLVLNRHKDSSISSIELLTVLQPLMMVTLLPVVLFHDIDIISWVKPSSMGETEQIRRLDVQISQIDETFDIETIGVQTKFILLLVSSVLAMACIIFETNVVKISSSTTLCVGGVGKEMLTLILSHCIFGDVFTYRAIFAVALSLAGILTYGYLEYLEKLELKIPSVSEQIERAASNVSLDSGYKDMTTSGLSSLESNLPL